jgi:ABC-type transport system involved in multi-copper enzyme maturation permease subunit
MTLTILKKEFFETLRTRRFAVAVALCLLLIPLSTYVNVKDYEQRLAAYQESDRLLHEPWTRISFGYDTPIEGFRPPSPYSVFSTGLDHLLPNKIVTSRDAFTFTNNQWITNPRAVLSGRIDLLFVVSIILSLLAFLFAASSFSAKIDDGELRFTLSSPVSRTELLFGKLIGGYLALLLPYLAGLALAGVIIATIGMVFPPDWATYFLLAFAVSALFLLSQFALAALVCLIVPRPGASLVVLMFVWIIVTFVIPQTTPMVAELIYPALPRQTVDLQKDLARHRCEMALQQQLFPIRDSMVAAYGLDPGQLRHPLDPLATEREKTIQTIYWQRIKPLVVLSQQDAADSTRRLDEQYQQSARKQEGLARALTLLTPVGCFGSFIAEISGTGVREMENLISNATLFHQQSFDGVYSRFSKEIYAQGQSIVPTGGKESLKAPPQIPYMTYQRVDVAKIFPSLILEVAILALYVVVLLVGLFVRFRTLNLVGRPSAGERR